MLIKYMLWKNTDFSNYCEHILHTLRTQLLKLNDVIKNTDKKYLQFTQSDKNQIFDLLRQIRIFRSGSKFKFDFNQIGFTQSTSRR